MRVDITQEEGSGLMEEAQIKALIAATLQDALKGHSKAILDDVTAYVENRAQLLEDSVNTRTAPTEAPAIEPDNALTARLALLEQELETARTERQKQDELNRSLKFKGTVADAISSYKGVLHPDVLTELMVTRLSDGYSEKDGNFITKNGKTVHEEITGFMETDAGKHFLTPVQTAVTSNNPTPDRRTQRAEAQVSLANALLSRNK